jgi:hypothetical protein
LGFRMAPELDADYQAIYGVLNDDMSRRTPTLGLICGLLGDTLKVRTALAASAGLTRWRLIEGAGAVLPHGDDSVRLDAAVVSWLLGCPTALFSDSAVGQNLHLSPWPGGTWLRTGGDTAEIERLANRLAPPPSDTKGHPWLALCGEDSDGWRAMVEVAAARASVSLARIVPRPSATAAADWADVSVRIVRAVLLLRAVLVLDLSAIKSDAEGDLDWLTALATVLTFAERPGVVIVAELDRIASAIPRERCELRHRAPASHSTLADVYVAAMSEAGLYLSASDAAQAALGFPLSLDGVHRAVRLASLNVSSDDMLLDACSPRKEGKPVIEEVYLHNTGDTGLGRAA